nr:lysine-rich arabinogalactan protein 19-like [Procambarus clarkii]XP_045619427.1 lysine-rich arabinogalactan protein 19-like [Procambarus clarkii]
MTMKGVFVCVAALVYAAAAMPPPGAASGVPPPPHTAATPSPAAAPVAAPFSMFSAFVPTAKEIADLQALNTTPAPGILPVAAIAGLPAAAIAGLPATAPGGLTPAAGPVGLPGATAPVGLPGATAAPLLVPTMPPAVAKLVAKYQAAAAAFSPTVPAPV